MIYVDPEIRKMLEDKRLKAAREMSEDVNFDESVYRFRTLDEVLSWIKAKEKAASDTDNER